jgi:hypothetical protein
MIRYQQESSEPKQIEDKHLRGSDEDLEEMLEQGVGWQADEAAPEAESCRGCGDSVDGIGARYGRPLGSPMTTGSCSQSRLSACDAGPFAHRVPC